MVATSISMPSFSMVQIKVLWGSTDTKYTFGGEKRMNAKRVI